MIIKIIRTLLYIPISWFHAFHVRKQPFEIKYQQLRKDIFTLMKILHLKLEVEGLEAIEQLEVASFISNHQGTFDPLWIVAACPIPLKFISKKENRNMIFLGSWAKTIEVFFFDREDTADSIHMIRETARNIKSGRSTLIFAEGTRSKSKKMNEMKSAAFKPGMIGKAPFVALTLVNSYDAINQVKKNGTMKVIFDVVDYTKQTKIETLAQTVQTKIQENLNQNPQL